MIWIIAATITGFIGSFYAFKTESVSMVADFIYPLIIAVGIFNILMLIKLW